MGARDIHASPPVENHGRGVNLRLKPGWLTREWNARSIHGDYLVWERVHTPSNRDRQVIKLQAVK